MHTRTDRSEYAGSPQGVAAEPCPACSEFGCRSLLLAQDSLYQRTENAYRIVECTGCRLIRLSPQPTPEEMASLYPPHFWLEPNGILEGVEGFYHRLTLRDHLHFVERGLREAEEGGLAPGSLIVDVGGGSLFLKLLASRGHKNVAGLHFGLDTAAIALHDPEVNPVCGTLSRPPFAPGSCGAITLFHVLEHLYDPAGYLDRACELLAPEGRLYLQVPNAGSWQMLLLGERWSGLDVPRHLFHFRVRDLENLLDGCGFEILRRKHFSWRDNPRMLATSLAPGLDPSVRRLRQTQETPAQKFWKDAGFLALAGLSLPAAILESASGAGATVMIEARKKS